MADVAPMLRQASPAVPLSAPLMRYCPPAVMFIVIAPFESESHAAELLLVKSTAPEPSASSAVGSASISYLHSNCVESLRGRSADAEDAPSIAARTVPAVFAMLVPRLFMMVVPWRW